MLSSNDKLKRKFKIYAECCQKFYNSYNEHNRKSGHIIKKRHINKLKCNNCNEIQEITNNCKKCNIKFAEYFCEKCKFLSNKEIKHCDDCNICYITENKQLKHCNSCNLCFDVNYFDIHNCNIQKNYNECQICLENFKIDNTPIYFFKCNHKIHKKCFKLYKDSCVNNNIDLKCCICRNLI